MEDSMKMKKMVAGVLACVLGMTTLIMPTPVLADRVEDKPFVSLGADLDSSEKTTVLQLLDLTEAELEACDVIEITNDMEHQYLGSYLTAEVIGSRSLSSVKVTGKDDGFGIQVETKNITYCTPGMYQNALATAGIENAEVVVAGPFPISGTAALVGAMEAYSEMTGEIIDPILADTATNELIVTGEVAENIGDSAKAEELIAAIKKAITEKEITSKEDIEEVIKDVSGQLNINLSEKDRQMILDLMQKISELDIDFDKLAEQAKDLYDRVKKIDLSKYGITQESVKGFLGQLGDFFSSLWDKLMELLQ